MLERFVEFHIRNSSWKFLKFILRCFLAVLRSFLV